MNKIPFGIFFISIFCYNKYRRIKMKCINCGLENDDNNTKCVGCGYYFKNEEDLTKNDSSKTSKLKHGNIYLVAASYLVIKSIPYSASGSPLNPKENNDLIFLTYLCASLIVLIIGRYRYPNDLALKGFLKYLELFMVLGIITCICIHFMKF